MTEKTALISAATSSHEVTDKDQTMTDCGQTNSLSIGSPKSRSYYMGCILSLGAAVVNAVNFVITQLLDDIAGVFQLNFGMYMVMAGFALCCILYTKQAPRLIQMTNIGYMILLVLSNLLYGLFAFLASVHIAVGTLNAVLILSFVATTLCYSLLKTHYNKSECQTFAITLDVATVVIVSVGVIFIVQPTELFYGIGYFNQTSDVYTSLCNSNRFSNISATNSTFSSITEIYKGQSWVGYLCAFLAGLCNTLAVASTQMVLDKVILQDMILWLSLISSAICLPVTALIQGFVFPQGTLCFVLLMLHAITGAIIYTLFFAGMCYISSIDVAIMAGFVLPILFICQFTFLGTISPTPTNTVAIVAAVVVLVTIVGKPILQGLLAHKGYIE